MSSAGDAQAAMSEHYRARGELIRLTAVGTAVVFIAVFFNHGFVWMFTAGLTEPLSLKTTLSPFANA